MLIWNWVVKDGCLLGWSVLVVWCGSSGLIWWSDGCRTWGWSGVVLRYGGLIWGGSGWLLWSFGLVWWSTMEVCLRKMVWSEYWKLKRWEAELIAVNGSIREKRDSCTRKVGKKIGLKEAWEKFSLLYPVCTAKPFFVPFLFSTFISKSSLVYSH